MRRAPDPRDNARRPPVRKRRTHRLAPNSSSSTSGDFRMQSKIASTLLALATAAALAAPGVASARDLMIVGFGGGFQDNARKHLFQGYEKATGVKVKDD